MDNAAIKTKVPSTGWLTYISKNLYYEDGQVYSRRSAYTKPLGSINSSGYCCVVLEPKRCVPRVALNIKLHHLVWYLNTGVWSDVELDHEDRDKLNNRFENLKQSNRVEQVTNRNNFKNRAYELRYIQHVKNGNYYRIVHQRKVLDRAETVEEAKIKRDNYGL